VQQITGDPTYFFIHPHRSFKTVDVEVWFQNQKTPLLELGALANEKTGAYNLHPLENLFIDESNWNRIEENGLVLLQRHKNFSSINEFLMHVPARDTIATYHYQNLGPFRLPDYKPSLHVQTFSVPLRGSHEFYTYIKDETLQFEIIYESQIKDELQPVSLRLFNENNQFILEVFANEEGKILLEQSGLPEGVYRIQIDAQDHVFFKEIRTPQQKLTFLNHLSFSDTSSAFSVWTQAKQVAFTIREAIYEQEVVFSGESFLLEKPYERYLKKKSSLGLDQIVLSKGHLVLDGIGHFAFSQDAWFNPDPIRLWPGVDLDALGVNYIISTYTSPRQEGEWKVQTIQFDASILATEKPGTWKFVFSAPEIENYQTFFTIKELRIILKRNPLTFDWILGEIQKYLQL
ncbi:hypothetical protein CO172_00990, partial [Candidatus Uhrbacteria bacterium CG_4_9_14_3_um_filter_36_7]